MSNRATEKIMEALSQLLEGFAELQDSLDTEYGDTPEVEDKESDLDEDEIDPDSLIVKELKIAIEGSIETDDYTPEEIANLIAALTEALEEVDPNVFLDDSDDDAEEEDDEEEEDDDDEDEDYDDDELDLDEDEEDAGVVEKDDEEEDEEDDAPKPRKKNKQF